MEIRKVEPLEHQQALAVWSQAFEDGDLMMDEWKEDDARWADKRTTYGIFDEHGLQACFQIHEEFLHFGISLQIKTGAVNGVASLPASRGKGYAKIGCRYILERMRENGNLLSILTPFNWDFYEELGWTGVGELREYSLPTRILKADPETENVRAAGVNDWPKIAEAYVRWAAKYRGMLARTDNHWKRILDSSKDHYTYTYIYEKEGQAEGYVVFKLKPKRPGNIREFMALTPRAYKGLLGLLRRHEMQIDKFIWRAPSDDMLWSILTHDEIKTLIRPNQMVRIVDVPEALQAWKPLSEYKGKVDIEVNDAHASWNEGVWRVEFEAGNVKVAKTNAHPDVTLGIQALAKAFFGTPSVEELFKSNKIMVHNQAGYIALNQLLEGPPMWISDSF